MLTCSALDGTGVPEIWEAVGEFRAALGNGILARRSEQAKEWLWSEVTASLIDTVRSNADTAARVRALEQDVGAGRRTPTSAARQILGEMLGTDPG